ncbi:MAG: hypothetical protein ACW98F_05620 [Candidatus Hodarchaeales archaeon]|jgi:hypothetical protein
MVKSGWDKIVFDVPTDWQLAMSQKETEKDKIKGIFTFKDLDQLLRMSVKWESVVKKVPRPPVIVDSYLKKLKKKYSKNPITVRSRKKIKIDGHNADYLLWESKKRNEMAVVVSWLCPERERIYLSFWPFKTNEIQELKSHIQQVIDSIKCHETWVTWRGPGITLHVPEELKLVETSFVIGTSYMKFVKGDTSIYVERFGLAKQNLSKFSSVKEFYKLKYVPKMSKRMKGFNYKEPKRYISRRKSIEEVWRRKFHLKVGKLVLKQKMSILQYFWVDTEKNAMFFVTLITGSSNETINEFNPRRIFGTVLKQLFNPNIGS